MLFVLGVGSAVGLQSSIVTNLMDIFPKVKNWQMAGICCVGGFLVGLVYVTPGGQWMLNLVDHFGGTFLIFALAILELAGIFWIYGLEQFCWDVEFMLKRKVTPFWRISWFIVTPLLMIVILLYTLAQLENPTFSGKVYPTSSLIAGWCIFAVGISQLFIWGIWIATRKNFGEGKSSCKAKLLFKPDPNWGPKSPKLRQQWITYKEEMLEKRLVKSKDHSKLQRIGWILIGKYDQ